MFYELMMRRFHSAKNYMELSVVGNPTINNGVVSNFSTTSYLESAGTYDFSQPFEVVLKLKTGVSASSGFLIVYNNNYGSFASLAGAGQRIGVWSKNTSDQYIANAVYTPSGSVLDNTTKYVKFTFTGTQYFIALSNDGITWTTTNTINNSTLVGSGKIIKLGATSGTQYFNGSIDISNSYIKLGSTKYKIVAVPEE